MLFGKDLSTLGSLGNDIGAPKYKLFTESVKKEVEEFGKLMEERISVVAKRIAEEKEKYLIESNSRKKVKHAYPLGTIVFLKDFSVPKSGRASKFRPRFLRSPNVVVSSSATSVVTMRLADGYISRHHPDDMLPYKGSEKTPSLHQDLPDSVLRFLGRPLSSEALVDLAEHGDLVIIYCDNHAPIYDKILTRFQKKKLEQAMELAKNLDMEKTDKDDEEDFAVSDSSRDAGSAGRRVSFGNDLAYSS